jgi:hypothetical protein
MSPALTAEADDGNLRSLQGKFVEVSVENQIQELCPSRTARAMATLPVRTISLMPRGFRISMIASTFS